MNAFDALTRNVVKTAALAPTHRKKRSKEEIEKELNELRSRGFGGALLDWLPHGGTRAGIASALGRAGGTEPGFHSKHPFKASTLLAALGGLGAGAIGGGLGYYAGSKYINSPAETARLDSEVEKGYRSPADRDLTKSRFPIAAGAMAGVAGASLGGVAGVLLAVLLRRRENRRLEKAYTDAAMKGDLVVPEPEEYSTSDKVMSPMSAGWRMGEQEAIKRLSGKPFKRKGLRNLHNASGSVPYLGAIAAPVTGYLANSAVDRDYEEG